MRRRASLVFGVWSLDEMEMEMEDGEKTDKEEKRGTTYKPEITTTAGVCFGTCLVWGSSFFSLFLVRTVAGDRPGLISVAQTGCMQDGEMPRNDVPPQVLVLLLAHFLAGRLILL